MMIVYLQWLSRQENNFKEITGWYKCNVVQSHKVKHGNKGASFTLILKGELVGWKEGSKLHIYKFEESFSKSLVKFVQQIYRNAWGQVRVNSSLRYNFIVQVRYNKKSVSSFR